MSETSLVKKNIFQNLYTIKSYISTHQGGIIWNTTVCQTILGCTLAGRIVFAFYTGVVFVHFPSCTWDIGSMNDFDIVTNYLIHWSHPKE